MLQFWKKEITFIQKIENLDFYEAIVLSESSIFRSFQDGASLNLLDNQSEDLYAIQGWQRWFHENFKQENKEVLLPRKLDQ